MIIWDYGDYVKGVMEKCFSIGAELKKGGRRNSSGHALHHLVELAGDNVKEATT